jgi:hypothetical protein
MLHRSQATASSNRVGSMRIEALSDPGKPSTPLDSATRLRHVCFTDHEWFLRGHELESRGDDVHKGIDCAREALYHHRQRDTSAPCMLHRPRSITRQNRVWSTSIEALTAPGRLSIAINAAARLLHVCFTDHERSLSRSALFHPCRRRALRWGPRFSSSSATSVEGVGPRFFIFVGDER